MDRRLDLADFVLVELLDVRLHRVAHVPKFNLDFLRDIREDSKVLCCLEDFAQGRHQRLDLPHIMFNNLFTAESIDQLQHALKQPVLTKYWADHKRLNVVLPHAIVNFILELAHACPLIKVDRFVLCNAHPRQPNIQGERHDGVVVARHLFADL